MKLVRKGYSANVFTAYMVDKWEDGKFPNRNLPAFWKSEWVVIE